MKKKIYPILLAGSMLLSLAACGGTPSDSSGQASPTTVQTAAPTEAAPVFEELVLVDDDNCTFKITGIEVDSPWGYTLNVFLENKTDLDLMFSLNNASVNGFMCDPLWATTVTPGMKANDEISFSETAFRQNGITEVSEIEFTLNVYDSNDWMADHLVDDVFSIYPLGEEAVQPFFRTAQEGEIILFDDENCTMIVTGFDPENTWGYTVNVYLENKTDRDLMFSISDASVNGFMCDPFWAVSVAAGKRSNTSISWSAEDFAANGITEVESLALPISVYDASNWTGDYLIDETFTVNP